MAFQLALGCRTVGYDQVHRTCCSNADSSCFLCKFPESISISSSIIGTGSPHPACDLPTIDGTYAWSLFTPAANDGTGFGGSACDWEYYIYQTNCSGLTQFIRLRINLIAESTPAGRKMRAQLLYSKQNNANQDYHLFLHTATFGDLCPIGTVNVPVTTTPTQLFSTAPTIDFNYPVP